MDVHRWHLVEEVLDRALGCEPELWPALLDEACRGDPELRAEVAALLARRGDAENFLASPPSAAASALVAEARAAAEKETVIPSSSEGSSQAAPAAGYEDRNADPPSLRSSG